jgi:VIT1/CCC1 family predicted Fe2+/Mn2+ transporter
MAIHPRLASHLGSGNVSRVVYGSIIGLALVLTMQAHPSTAGIAIGTLLATAVAVGLAELYSDLVGARARTSVGGAGQSRGAIAEDAAAVAFGVAFPSVFFLAAVLGLLEYDTAFTAAKWTGLALIAGYGYVAARLSGATAARALLEALSVGLIAAVLIALKALVH